MKSRNRRRKQRKVKTNPAPTKGMKTWQKILLGVGVIGVAYKYRATIKGWLVTDKTTTITTTTTTPVKKGSYP